MGFCGADPGLFPSPALCMAWLSLRSSAALSGSLRISTFSDVLFAAPPTLLSVRFCTQMIWMENWLKVYIVEIAATNYRCWRDAAASKNSSESGRAEPLGSQALTADVVRRTEHPA